MKNSETLVGKFELRPETNVGVNRAQVHLTRASTVDRTRETKLSQVIFV